VVRFAALGDMGTGSKDQMAIAQRMTSFHDERPYEIVLTMGDNLYASGPAAMSARFELPYGDLLKSGVVFHATLGNHDVRHGREAEINYPNFNMGGRSYYTFVAGDDLVEFFALDSTSMHDTQLKWLEGALAGSKARWKIAFMHHPMFSSAATHGSDLKLRALLEPLFIRYGVSVVLAGHDHVYERIKLQSGIQYFISGVGGQLRRGDLDRKSPLFAAGNDQVHSFMFFEVTSYQLLFWAVDNNGTTLDSGRIEK
jgi:hypothetical protein